MKSIHLIQKGQKIILEKMSSKEKEKEGGQNKDGGGVANRPQIRQNIDDITAVICFFGVNLE